MNLPVKLGLGVLGTAGAATSVYYGGSYLLDQKEMPSWRPLVQDSEFLNSSGAAQPNTQFSGKYSADKARLLVGTGGDSSSQIKNKDWWDWVFRNRYKLEQAKFKGGFKDLKKGAKIDSPGNESIQEACDKAYKAEASKIKTDDPTDSTVDEFKEEHVWLLCSAMGSKPKTIDEAAKSEGGDKSKLEGDSNWKGKLGETKKADLLAIYDPGNTNAWEELDKQYKAAKPTGGFFKLGDTNVKDIKSKCEEAYGKDSVGDDNGKPKEEDLYKWCSFKGYKSN